jgi:hypothetical protein
MSEADVVEQLGNHTDTLIAGLSLIFSIVSAYIVALNYFIGSSNLFARLGSFAFVTLVLAMLAMLMMGVQSTHNGLIARLEELQAAGQLSAAGAAVLANATPKPGGGLSLDGILNFCATIGLGFVYVALAYMTFLHQWTPDAIPVTIQRDAPEAQSR